MKITGEKLFNIMQEAAAKVVGTEDDDELLTWVELDDEGHAVFNTAAELIEKQAE